MTKSELFKRMWIRISRRLPIDADYPKILFVTDENFTGISNGTVMNLQQKQLQNNIINKDDCPKNSAYHAVKWMEITI